MRDFFVFRLTRIEGGEVDIILQPGMVLEDAYAKGDEEKKSVIGTWISMPSGGERIGVKQVREQIYGMDKYSLFKKSWGNQ